MKFLPVKISTILYVVAAILFGLTAASVVEAGTVGLAVTAAGLAVGSVGY